MFSALYFLLVILPSLHTSIRTIQNASPYVSFAADISLPRSNLCTIWSASRQTSYHDRVPVQRLWLWPRSIVVLFRTEVMDDHTMAEYLNHPSSMPQLCLQEWCGISQHRCRQHKIPRLLKGLDRLPYSGSWHHLGWHGKGMAPSRASE